MARSSPENSVRTVYQVSELAEILRGLLEDSLPRLWIQGEISNLSRPSSGHWYFTLKDDRAQIRCAMFKGSNFHVRPQPKEGDQVLVRGQVTLYPARGDLQLICEHMEPAGEGALLRAFEQLKARLAAEGLFDEKSKRPLPQIPRAIGVITSATGAAAQDILTTLSRRFPIGQVYLLPVPVQGAEAAPAIVKALAELPKKAPVDVIILARGGGSLEDLWAFNEEAVARAIRACTVPVISGVGHEIDFTIADFAADLRAPTPTAAAELVSPDVADWMRQLRRLGEELSEAISQTLFEQGERLQRAESRIQLLHPGRRLNEVAQRLDELELRLEQARYHLTERLRARLQTAQARLLNAHPGTSMRLQKAQTQTLESRLCGLMTLRLQQSRASLNQAQSVLQSLSPRAVLERGYAVARTRAGTLVTDASMLAAGDTLEILLAHGVAETEVKTVKP
jgi:exodeoxyribonuclease VII large subunit